MARGIFDAYLSGEAAPFFRAHFSDPRLRAESVTRVRRPLQPQVFEALASQNAKLAPSPARDRHLDALREGAAAVVTGQQAGLFLGPLYTLYKAMTAILAAKRLTAETNTPVVPVFWVQSEDHDLPEVSSIRCPPSGSNEREATTIPLPASEHDRISVVHRPLPPELESCLNQLSQSLAGLPFADAHLARLRKHYVVGASYTQAFTGLLAELTSEHGLVFINPRDPALGREAEIVHRESIGAREAISELLFERGALLAAAGHSAPVHVRPGAPLCFFHPSGPEGPRFRLEPRGTGLALVGEDAVPFSEAELIRRLEAEPLCFSTSALSRPLLEAHLLPTAMYVGGPGEVAYLAQVQPLYERFGLEAPIVLPRARLIVVEPEIRRILDRLAISASEVAPGEERLLAKLVTKETSAGPGRRIEHELLSKTSSELEGLRAEIAALGPGLDRALDRTKKTIEVALGRFIRKIERAEMQRDQEMVGRVQRLCAALFPGGVPQERVFGFSRYAARHGEAAFMTAIERAIDPFEPRVSEVHP